MNQNNTIEQLLIYGKSILKQKNIDSWAIDAQVLLMYVTKFSKVKLFSHNKQLINDSDCDYYRQLINKRAQGCPIQYITGVQEFMSLEFNVNTYTLIPRADTEILVETLLEVAKKEDISHIMDVGTGTACIPISLLYYNNAMDAIAIDISEQALEVARKNADKHQVSDRIEFIKSDLFENLSNQWIGKLDAIVSNPPYIRPEVIPTLMREVREYEPITALVGGTDGLEFYRKITEQGCKYIRQGGFLIYEIGYDQAVEVAGIMQQQGFVNIKVIKDLAGLDRVVIGNKN